MAHKNNDKRREWWSRYYAEHREELAAKKKAYRAAKPEEQRERFKRWKEENKEHCREYMRQYWASMPPAELEAYRDSLRSLARDKWAANRAIVDRVKLHYGCCNPDCPWLGPFLPSQLQFHHVNPDEKENVIRRYMTHKPPALKLFAEMRKCTVVCGNCHAAISWEGLDASSFPLCQVDDEGNPL